MMGLDWDCLHYSDEDKPGIVYLRRDKTCDRKQWYAYKTGWSLKGPAFPTLLMLPGDTAVEAFIQSYMGLKHLPPMPKNQVSTTRVYERYGMTKMMPEETCNNVMTRAFQEAYDTAYRLHDPVGWMSFITDEDISNSL